MLRTTDFPYEVVGNDSAYFLNRETLFCDVFTRVLFPRASSFIDNCVFSRGRVSPMSGWICQWKPLWIPVGDNNQKAYLEEWLCVGEDSTGDPGEDSIKAIPTANVSAMVRCSETPNCTVKHKRPEEAPSAPRPTEQPDAPTWELLGPQGTASFWERTEAPLPPSIRQCNFIHPKQLSPFPVRLELPFPGGEILSGYEHAVSSGTDQFTTWVKTDPDVTSVRHMVDVQKAVAEFREASARRLDTSSQVYHFDNIVLNRSPVQKRLSIYNWNPGPRRGKEGAFEKQIAGKWHVITLQEAIEYVDHDILTNRFHVTTTEEARCSSTRKPSTLIRSQVSLTP